MKIFQNVMSAVLWVCQEYVMLIEWMVITVQSST